VSTTEFRVRGREALDWWAGRLEKHGVRHGGVDERDGRSSIAFTIPRASGFGLRTRARLRSWLVVFRGRIARCRKSSGSAASGQWT
jgi:hypothetical protein